MKIINSLALNGATRDGGWGELTSDVFWKVVECMCKYQSWRQSAQPMHLVNKHWRYSIRQRFTVIRPHSCRSFSWPRDFYSLLAFPNLHSLCLENRDTIEATAVNERHPSPFPSLAHLEILDASLLKPLLCCISNLKTLCIKRMNFDDSTLLETVAKQTSLRGLCLESSASEVSGDVLGFLVRLTNLEHLKLSYTRKERKDDMHSLTHLRRLQSLRIPIDNFLPSRKDALTELTALSSLKLDGALQEDALDLSTMPWLLHLSLSSMSMPVWIEKLSALKSLELETVDDFRRAQSRNMISAILPQLTAMKLRLGSPCIGNIRQALLRGGALEKLEIEGGTPIRQNLQICHRLKELKIIGTRHTTFERRLEFMTAVGELQRLQTLYLDLKNGIEEQVLFSFRQPNAVARTLKKLVVHRLDIRGARIIVENLHELQDWRIHSAVFPLRSMSYRLDVWNLRSLTNLCFSGNRALIDAIDMTLFLSQEYLKRLEHLGLPNRAFDNEESRAVVERFRQRYTLVRVDNNPGWEPTPSV